MKVLLQHLSGAHFYSFLMDDRTSKVEDKLVVVMCLVNDNNSEKFESRARLFSLELILMVSHVAFKIIQALGSVDILNSECIKG